MPFELLLLTKSILVMLLEEVLEFFWESAVRSECGEPKAYSIYPNSRVQCSLGCHKLRIHLQFHNIINALKLACETNFVLNYRRE